MKPKKKKITNRWLLQHEAPERLIEWIKNKKERDPLKILRLLTKDNADQIVWLITKIMQDKDCIAYAVYATEQVIDICQLPLPKGRGLQFQEKEHWRQESGLRFGYWLNRVKRYFCWH